MKRIICFLLLVVMILGLIPPLEIKAIALTDGDYTYSVSGGAATITGLASELSGDIVIPSEIGGYPVKKIGSKAFSLNLDITGVTIPNTVEEIGEMAFDGCTKIKWVKLGKNVKKIHNQAFAYCNTMESINFPDGLTSIGTQAFFNCIWLGEINLPDSVTSIGQAAFRQCWNLARVKLSDNIEAIPDETFYNCTNIYTLALPKKLQLIGRNAFYNCQVLTSLIVPDSLVSINTTAFTLCRSGLSFYGSKGCYGETYAANLGFSFFEYDGIEYSDTDNDLEYPIYDETRFAQHLRYMINSNWNFFGLDWYRETYENEFAEIPLTDLLEMTIDIPVQSDEQISFSVEGDTKVKHVIAYLLFAERAQEYLEKMNVDLEESFSTGDAEKIDQGYRNFLACVHNFNRQFYNFQNALSGDDSYFKTLNSLILARSALGVSEELGSRYFTSMYQATVSKRPEQYTDIKYYILSGGDAKYLDQYSQDTLKECALNLKKIKKAAEIATDSEGAVDFPSMVSIGLDNLSYFSEKYDSIYADKIKKLNDEWENAQTGYELFKALVSSNYLGTLSLSYGLITDYIDSAVEAFESKEEKEDAWYALCYYYLGKNNEKALKALMDEETGFSNGLNSAYYGIPQTEGDRIERELLEYWNNHAYLGYSYTPDQEYRFYLWNICNQMQSIEEITIREYATAMIEYIYAELNLDQGDVGVPAELTVSANDATLGSVEKEFSDTMGHQATVVATPYENVSFSQWVDASTGVTVSQSATYTFPVYQNTQLLAEFVAGDCKQATVPKIQKQPVSATYYLGTSAMPLTLSAIAEDGGEISVDWYQNTTNRASGGTKVGSGLEFEPSVAEIGTVYYYAVVTNTVETHIGTNIAETYATAVSNTVKIVVEGPTCMGITVEGISDDRVYPAEDPSEIENIRVYGVYTDQSIQELKNFAVSYDFSSTGKKSVKVSFFEYEKDFRVYVTASPLADLPEMQFKGASLSLKNTIAINYKANKAFLAEGNYTDPFVVFEMNGKRTVVDAYSVDATDSSLYSFSFRNIHPDRMNDVVRSSLLAYRDGVLYCGETREYSISEYCYAMLEECKDEKYATLRTLLVDLLRYGSACQLYSDYMTDTLVDGELTTEQTSWGTCEQRELNSVLNIGYKTVENPKAIWKGAGLNLKDSVRLRFKIQADTVAGLEVKIQGDHKTWRIPSDQFVKTDGAYYVYFGGLSAAQMSESLYLTVYEGDTAISNTICYSIESYAYEKQNSTIPNLAELVKAMMRYGDSARIYAG